MAKFNPLLDIFNKGKTQSQQAASSGIGRSIDSQQEAWSQSLRDQPSTFKAQSLETEDTTPKTTNPLLTFTDDWKKQQEEKSKPKKKGLFGITIPDDSDDNPWAYDATNNILDTTVPAKQVESANPFVEPEKPKRQPIEYSDAFLKQEDQKDAWSPTWENGKTVDETKGDSPNFWERALNTVKGAGKQLGSSYTNALGTLLDFGGENSLFSNLAASQSRQNALLSPTLINEDYNQMVEDVQREGDEAVKQAAVDVFTVADSLGESAQADLNAAKDGLGKFGQAGIDIGTNIIQMGSDALVGMLSGGSSLVPLGIRVFGQSSQEARQEGASTNEQVLYGLTNAGIEILTEKMADGLAGIYGKGAADDIAEEAIRKLAKSDSGRTLLRFLYGANSEGFEEVVSDLLNPYAKMIYNDKSFAETFGDGYDASELLYDYLIGAALGGFGGAANIAKGGNADANAALRATDAVEAELVDAGVDAYTAEQIAPTMEKYITGDPLTSHEKNILMEIRNREDIAAGSPQVENFLTEALTAQGVEVPSTPVGQNPSKASQLETELDKAEPSASATATVSPATTAEKTGTNPLKAAWLETGLDAADPALHKDVADLIAEAGADAETANILTDVLLKGASGETLTDEEVSLIRENADVIERYIENAEAEEDGNALLEATGFTPTTETNRGVNPNKAAQIETELDKNAERITEIQQEIADLEQQAPSAERDAEIRNLIEEQTALENGETVEEATAQESSENAVETQEESGNENIPTESEENLKNDLESNTAESETTEQSTEENQESETTSEAETNEEYDKLGEKYGTIEEGENPVRESAVPKQTTDDTKVSESVRTVVEAEATPESRLPDIKSAVVDGRVNFTPTTNAEIAQNARAKVEEMGWQKALNQWTADVRSGKANADLVAEGAVLLNNAANNNECSGAEYIDIMLDYIKLNRVLGKGLAAARILKTLTPEGKLYAFQKVVNNMNEARAEQASKKGKTAADALAEKYTIDPALIEEYNQQTTDEGRDAVLEKMEQNIADQIPATLKDKFTALRYLNMLGNLKTQARNVFGNTGNMLVYKAKNTVRSAMETVAQQMSDGKYEKQYSAFYGTELKSAANQYYNTHPDVQKETMGERKFANVGQEFESGIEEKRTIFKSKILQKYSQLTNWMMEAGDQIFCKATFTDSLAGYLQAHNITAEEWTSLVNEADADPTSEAADTVDKATQFAIKQAQEATFRDTNAVSQAISTFDSNWSRFGKTLSQGIIPFRKTPANVLVRMEEFSPLGFINTALKAAQAYKGVNNVTAQDVIDSLAKSVTGAGLTTLGFILAAAGKARTKTDDDKQEAFDKLKGLQDYSITIGGKNFTADWLTPESAALFMGVELYNLASDGTITAEDSIKIIGNLTSPMLEMSMLSGVNDALDNIASFNDDTEALPQFLLNSAWGYLSQGLTNTLLGQLEQGSEKYRQSYYTDSENPILTPSMQKMLAKAGNKTPGIDFQAADYIDAWGRKQENIDNPFLRYANALVNPSYYSNMDEKATAVDDELQRLYEYGQDIDRFPNVFPQQTSRSTKVNGTRLSPEEYDKYATTKGQKSLELVEELIKSSEYKKMTDDEKAAAVNDMYSYATQLAAEKVAESRGEDYDFSNSRYKKMETAEDKGISASQYYGYYQKYKELDDDKSLTAQQKAEKFSTYVINQRGLSESQKSFLRDSFNFTTTLVADTKSYDKWIAAGLTPEQAEGFNKKINTDGSKSISNAERYAAIEQYATDAEMAEKLWEAMGSSTWSKSGKSYFQANPSSKFKSSWSGKTYSTPGKSSSSSSSSSSGNPLLKNWNGGSSSGTSTTSSSSGSSGNILLNNWNKG